MSRAVTTILVAAFIAIARAQAPSFEVASVKANKSGPRGSVGLFLLPGGRVVAQNVPLRDLIRSAYLLEDIQLEGGPAWAGADRFDLEARTRADAGADEVRAMVRTLLAERFHFAAHTEARPMATYALVTNRSDRKLGPAMRASGPDCALPTTPPGFPAPPPPPPGSGLALGGLPFRCPSGFLPGHLSLRSIDMPGLAIVLWRRAGVGRPVADRTGLTGNFDIDLNYAAEDARINGALLPTEGLPSVFTAVQEQLGLKLESTRSPVDVLVIDRVDLPTDN